MRADKARQTLLRALRLRCPACGQGRLFRTAFRMRERCPSCGLNFGREQGYFVGAIYVNVVATNAVILCVYVAGVLLAPSLAAHLIPVLVALALTLPLLFFRHSRSLWLCIDHFVSPVKTGTNGRA